MKNNIFKILQVLLFLSIGIFILWYVFSKQDIHSIILELSQTNYYWIFISLVIGLLSHVFRALRWNLLFVHMGYKTNVSTTTYAVLIGYLANLAVPRMGEITRCGVLSKSNAIPIDKVIGSVFSERAFDMLCLLIILVLTVLLQISFLGEFFNKYVYSNLMNGIENNFSILIIIILTLLGFIFIGFKFIKPLFKKYPFYLKFKQLYIGFIDGIKSIIHLKQVTLFILYTFCIWLCYSLMVYTCLLAMPATFHLSFIDAITIMAIGSVGIVIPVPGGIGTYHYIVSLVLTDLFFISGSNALAFATISHSSQTLLILFGGSISMLLIFLNKKK